MPRFKSGDPVVVTESNSQFTVGDTAIVDDDPYSGATYPSGHSLCMIKVMWTASSRGVGLKEKIYERRLELMRPKRSDLPFKIGQTVVLDDTADLENPPYARGDTAIVRSYAAGYASGHQKCMILIEWTSGRRIGKVGELFERRFVAGQGSGDFKIPPCSQVTTSPEKIWELLVNASTAGSR